MALLFPYMLHCRCGAAFEVNLCEYVFVEHDPKVKLALATGDFNGAVCPVCHEALDADISFLYRDEALKLWIWVRGKAEREQGGDWEAERIAGYSLTMQEEYRHYQVDGRAGLLELLAREDRDFAPVA